MSHRARRVESEYRPIHNAPMRQLGMLDSDEQVGAHMAAAIGRNSDQTLSPQVQIQRTLQGSGMGDAARLQELTRLLRDNPLVLNQNPLLANELRRNEFFQQHRQEIAAAITAPDPENPGARIPQDRRDMADRIAGLTPDRTASHGRNVQVQHTARAQLPSPTYG